MGASPAPHPPPAIDHRSAGRPPRPLDWHRNRNRNGQGARLPRPSPPIAAAPSPAQPGKQAALVLAAAAAGEAGYDAAVASVRLVKALVTAVAGGAGSEAAFAGLPSFGWMRDMMISLPMFTGNLQMFPPLPGPNWRSTCVPMYLREIMTMIRIVAMIRGWCCRAPARASGAGPGSWQ